MRIGADGGLPRVRFQQLQDASDLPMDQRLSSPEVEARLDRPGLFQETFEYRDIEIEILFTPTHVSVVSGLVPLVAVGAPQVAAIRELDTEGLG